jgi:sugar lactone lactonase YvrE
MRARLALLFSATLALPVAAQTPPDPAAEARRLLTEAAAAHEKKDYALFLQKTQAAVVLSPRSPRALYNLACAYALTAHPEDAVATLDRITALGVYLDAAADSDFTGIKDTALFKAAVARAAGLNLPVAAGVEALRLKEKDLVTEGLAHDPQSGDFFLSSVHKRKIVRVGRDGVARDFVGEGQGGLWSVLALKVDAPRKLLWATSAALREGLGFRKEDEGKSALFAFHLDSGKLARRIEAPADGKKHNLNDLAADGQGRLFVSDAMSGHVYALSPGAEALRVLVEPGVLASPQGLVLSPDARTLWVADYARGLARVDVASGKVHMVDPPADAVLAGIDGLVAHGRDLIAIQNGIRPHRVVRIALDGAGTAVVSVKVLERAHPAYDEPTLGVIVGDDLHYIANSQWGSFTKEGALFPLEKLHEPIVLRLRLR